MTVHVQLRPQQPLHLRVVAHDRGAHELGAVARHRTTRAAGADFTASADGLVIGSSAFYDCASLLAVQGGSGALEILDSAFQGCGNLERADFALADGSSFGTGAFHRCDKLEYLALPPTVASMGTRAFAYNCDWDGLNCATLPSLSCYVGPASHKATYGGPDGPLGDGHGANLPDPCGPP